MNLVKNNQFLFNGKWHTIRAVWKFNGIIKTIDFHPSNDEYDKHTLPLDEFMIATDKQFQLPDQHTGSELAKWYHDHSTRNPPIKK